MPVYKLTADPYIPNFGTKLKWVFPRFISESLSPTPNKDLRLIIQRSPNKTNWPLQPYVATAAEDGEDVVPAPQADWTTIHSGTITTSTNAYYEFVDNMQPNPVFNYRIVLFYDTNSDGLYKQFNYIPVSVTRALAPGDIQWAVRFSGISTEFGKCCGIDSVGNYFITGVFRGLVTFAPGVSLQASASNSVFIAKYSSSGTLIWAKLVVGGATSSDVYSMAIDSSDNIYLGGTFTGGSLVKLDSSGTLVWVKGPTNFVAANVARFKSISLTTAGKIVATGEFVAIFANGEIDFGDGKTLFSSSGSIDGFVAKYATDGTCEFAQRFENSGDTEYGIACIVDQAKGDTILIAGYAFANVNPGGGNLVNTGSSYGAYGFLVRLQADGTYNAGATYPSFQRTFGVKPVANQVSYSYCRVDKMALDSNGDVIIGCEWNYIAEFGLNGGDAAGGTVSGGSSFNSLALAKYNGTTGALIWVRPFMGSQGTFGAIVTDSNNNIYFTGSIIRPMTFQSTIVTPYHQDGTDYFADAYLAKYNSSGSLIWVNHYGGTSYDNGVAVALDKNEVPFITGDFSNSIDGSPAKFGSTITLLAAGDLDGFLAKVYN